jgi:hypothetical protein
LFLVSKMSPGSVIIDTTIVAEMDSAHPLVVLHKLQHQMLDKNSILHNGN